MSTSRNSLASMAVFAILLVAGLAAAVGPEYAHGAAPMQSTTSAGWYRMKLGDFEVTALSDGTKPTDAVQLLQNPQADTQRALAAAFLPQPYEMNFNAFLINTGQKLILIDAGAGNLFGKGLGELAERLRESGYRPDEVDAIYLTHMHPDHIGGLTLNGHRVFRNAVVRVSKRAADFWLSQSNMDGAPASQKFLFKDVMSSLEPYIKAGRFDPFSGDIELSSGISALAEPGHTPGHTGYMVESEGHKMLVWGDIINFPVLQFADPKISSKYDSDASQAAAIREKILADAARDGWLIAGSHLGFPGLGHVIKEGAGYRWLAVTYREIHRIGEP